MTSQGEMLLSSVPSSNYCSLCLRSLNGILSRQGAPQGPSTSPRELLLELQRNKDIVMYATSKGKLR